MHILAKLGIILLVVGIVLFVIGIYYSLPIASLALEAAKLVNSTSVTLSPNHSYNVTYSITSVPSLGFFAYNYSSPISVIVPSGFVKASSTANEVVYEYGTRSPVILTVQFFNNESEPVTVYYTFISKSIPSIIILGDLGIFIVIVSIIMIIVGLILGRRKKP